MSVMIYYNSEYGIRSGRNDEKFGPHPFMLLWTL